METKVVLCCIKPLNDSLKLLANRHLASSFQQFGSVKAAKIFEREPIIKAFIEFYETKSASLALSSCNDQETQYGNIRLYPSKKKLIITNIEHKQKKERSNKKSSEETTSPEKSPEFNPYSQSIQKVPNQKFIKDSHLNIKQSANSGLFHLLQWTPMEGSADPSGAKNKLLFETADKNQIGRKLLTKPGFGLIEKSFQNSDSFLDELVSEPRVLKVMGLNSKGMCLKYLLNLFGYFGHVTKIWANKIENYALIEYDSNEKMKTAKDSLWNIVLFGLPLKISVSKFRSLKMDPTEQKNPSNPLKFLNVSKPEKYYRFDDGVWVGIPSQVLQITNVPIRLNAMLLNSLFSIYVKPRRIIKLDSMKSDTLSFVIEFETLNDAIDALAIFQNQKVDDKELKIVFSNSRVLKPQSEVVRLAQTIDAFF